MSQRAPRGPRTDRTAGAAATRQSVGSLAEIVPLRIPRAPGRGVGGLSTAQLGCLGTEKTTVDGPPRVPSSSRGCAGDAVDRRRAVGFPDGAA